MIAVLMPTTLADALASGPPELPGLIAASVWITFSMSRPLSPLIERPRALTTPAVTLRWKPRGFPIATTSWPTTRSPASPSVATVGSSSVSKRTTARSLGGSSPSTSAETDDPSESVTCISPPGLPALRLRRPRTTWLLVMAVAESPSRPSITPLPPPRPSGRPTEITAGSSLSVTSRTAREEASSSASSSRELAERFSKISIRYLYRTADTALPGRTARYLRTSAFVITVDPRNSSRNGRRTLGHFVPCRCPAPGHRHVWEPVRAAFCKRLDVDVGEDSLYAVG